MYLLLKALLSGAIVAVASELARRSSLLGAVLISLPLTSILAAIWLYRGTREVDEVADLSWSILWVIFPSLAFFVVLPVALRRGVEFWPALLLACAVTARGRTIAAALCYVWRESFRRPVRRPENVVAEPDELGSSRFGADHHADRVSKDAILPA